MAGKALGIVSSSSSGADATLFDWWGALAADSPIEVRKRAMLTSMSVVQFEIGFGHRGGNSADARKACAI